MASVVADRLVIEFEDEEGRGSHVRARFLHLELGKILSERTVRRDCPKGGRGHAIRDMDSL